MVFCLNRLNKIKKQQNDCQVNGDACTGDGGGPLMCPRSTDISSMVQVGIVSWGIGCGTTPGVYTDVGQFTDWITKMVAENVQALYWCM